MLEFLLGIQDKFTKFSCFLRKSRADSERSFYRNSINVSKNSLVPKEKKKYLLDFKLLQC